MKENVAQIKQLQTENTHLVTLLTSVTAENEGLHLVVKELETEKEENAKKFDMLFKVLSKIHGINFDAEHAEIEIEEIQAKAAERIRIAEAKAAKAGKGKRKVGETPLIEQSAPEAKSVPEILTLSIEIVTEEEQSVNFVLVGELIDVSDPTLRQKVTDRRKMYAEVEDKVDAYNKDEDEEEDTDVAGKSDRKVDDDDKKDDDSSQGGSGLKVNVSKSNENIDLDVYLNDCVNHDDTEQVRGELKDSVDESEQSGILTATPMSVVPDVPNPRVFYLEHDVVEGEFVHNYTKEEIAEMLGVDEDSFEFDFEDELESPGSSGSRRKFGRNMTNSVECY
ncbi:hypothetical protein Hanom_Chr14g01258661 [Helianthus anomalus]